MTKYNICIECNKEFTGRKKKYCSKECSDEVRRRSNRERMRKANPPKPDVTIICEWCGELHTVPARTAHQARFCSDDCRYTFRSREVGHRPIELLEEEWEENRLKRELDYLKRLRVKECDWCGDTFETTHPTHVTCSSECSKSRGRSIKDNRLNESNIVDRDITLARLFVRDKGICYLCGEVCDYNDSDRTVEGYHITGGTYPSVDHVKPLSKGGKHSWDNVKLAHHRCNAIKGNSITKGDSKALA